LLSESLAGMGDTTEPELDTHLEGSPSSHWP